MMSEGIEQGYGHGANGAIEREETVGQMVERFIRLSDVIAGAHTERGALETTLRARGVRLPGMACQRRAKLAAPVKRARKATTSSIPPESERNGE